ncbi:MAG TPA: calcium/sodium antiporter [Gemmatimonadaceae bacterium]
MELAIALGYVVLGLALLTGGGEALVRGATAIARIAGLTPAVIGLTIVAMGTSLPELVVSVIAAVREQPDIAVGNVVGSNIFNIAVVLGVTALILPLPVRSGVVRLEWPVMFAVSVLALVFARDHLLDRAEGGFFLLSLVIFTAWVVRLARREVTARERAEYTEEVEQRTLHPRRGREMIVSVGAVLLGVGLLIGGGHALVEGAATLARLAGMSERVIGLTVVAAGTSAPELATSLVAAWRRQTDVAVANCIGSNIFNILGILGVTAVVTPTPISPAVLSSDMWWMLGTSLVLFPLMRTNMRIGRTEGGILFAIYLTYLALLLRSGA